MSVTPPRDFWPPTYTLNGVLYANAPLSISSMTMSVADASLTSSGVVNTALQSMAGAKNFNDGLTAGGSQLITSISTDNTFAIATDSQLATKKAIKDYISSGGGGMPITSVSLPLDLTLGNLSIYDASPTSSGVVNTVGQTFTGAKRFQSVATFDDDVKLTESPNSTLYSSTDGSRLDITSTNSGSLVETQSLLYGGNLRLQSSPAAGKEIQMYNGAATTLSLSTSDTNVLSFRPTSIVTAGTQLTLVSPPADNATFTIVAGGDLTINTSGNDLNFHATDAVHVLNVTAASSKTTGAFTVNGGVGFSGASYADRFTAIGTATPHFTAIRTAGTQSSLAVGPLGETTVDATGSSPEIDLTLNAVPKASFRATSADFATQTTTPLALIRYDPTHYTSITPTATGTAIIETTGASLTIRHNSLTSATLTGNVSSIESGLELNGLLKYKNIPPIYIPVGAGPFDDYPISSIDYAYEISLASATTGAHFTGFAPVAPHNSREVMLYFVSTAFSKTVVIEHNGGGSLAANRVWCPNSVNLVLTVNPAAVLRLFYEPYAGRWLVVSST